MSAANAPVGGGGSPYIRIENVSKRFGEFIAVDDISLDIQRDEFFALLGASGCGKSTLLRMLAGLETPTSGRILIDGQDMTHVPPYERPVNMMFQSYALFPHMSVEANVAFGLKQDRMPADQIKKRVSEMLDLVQLGRFARRKPHQLSGGQRQRVALARSLAKHPKLLLLDEPLAALDKKLREQTQFELMNIQEQIGITFIVVTHDQEEAMTLATRIAVMDNGKIKQIGTPADVYEFPGSRFVADFLGSINLFEGELTSAGDPLTVRIDGDPITMELDHRPQLPECGKVAVAIRPEKITISKERPDQDSNVCTGKVDEIAYQGSISVYQVRLASGKLVRVTAPNNMRSARRPITWEDNVWLAWDQEAGVLLVD
jgi:putrescine transport system ATP-binding protein